jgi:hypothetical protein
VAVLTSPDDSHDPEDEIEAIVRGIAPLDWTQMRLTAALTPAQRIHAGMQAQAFAKAIFRGSLMKRFPDMPLDELNMMVLAHFTPVRMRKL